VRAGPHHHFTAVLCTGAELTSRSHSKLRCSVKDDGA